MQASIWVIYTLVVTLWYALSLCHALSLLIVLLCHILDWCLVLSGVLTALTTESPIPPCALTYTDSGHLWLIRKGLGLSATQPISWFCGVVYGHHVAPYGWLPYWREHWAMCQTIRSVDPRCGDFLGEAVWTYTDRGAVGYSQDARHNAPNPEDSGAWLYWLPLMQFVSSTWWPEIIITLGYNCWFRV